MKSWVTVVLATVMINARWSSSFQVSVDFCYTEKHCSPYAWGNTFRDCIPMLMRKNSPINIDGTAVAVKNLGPLNLTGYEQTQDGSWIIGNSRDSIVVEFADGMEVSGGGLPGVYKTMEMKVRWGSPSANGSEHTLNKHRFPMEMQIANILPNFTSVQSTEYQAFSLAMLGVFIDIGPDHNKAFETIASKVSSVAHPGDSVTVPPIPLLDLLPRGNLTRFYRYCGSRTIPPCDREVEWLVFEVPIYISQTQYERFTSGVFYSDVDDPNRKELLNNHRHLQARFDRVVSASPDATHSDAMATLWRPASPSLLPIIITLTQLPRSLCVA